MNRESDAMIDDDMRAVIAAQRLCYAATVGADGRPNLSPKGTIRVWDDTHLFFCDIASPTTRANLAVNPWIELNVVDPLSRRGYRFRGTASLHAGDAIYREALARLAAEERVSYAVHAVALVEVERALSIASPAYERVPDEAAMRELWRSRRQGLEAEFELHLSRRDAWRPDWAR
jgi:predicted pyridoxine 5'-phosphate oxidase superfamily flavin-nucleotide-binding protein